MGVQTCRVTVADVSGIRHTVEVSAESLFEAAAQAVAMFRGAPWMDEVGPGTRLEVEVHNPGVRHSLTVMQIQKWLQSGGNTPADLMRKKRVTELLRSEPKQRRSRGDETG